MSQCQESPSCPQAEVRAAVPSWRTPVVIIVCGCVIAMLAFGPRSASGQFLTPMSMSYGWGREVFSLALAIQNLLWGVGQPFAGAIADRFGTIRVLCGGAILYALGLALMAYSQTPAMLQLIRRRADRFRPVRLLVQSGDWRVRQACTGEHSAGLAFGAGTAAGSFGQFLFSPLARAFIDQFNWQIALLIFAALMLLILPLSIALATPRAESSGAPGSAHQSVGHTGSHGSVRTSQLCASGARLFHLRLPARFHYRASAGLSGGSRNVGGDRRLDHRPDRLVQYRGLADVRLAAGTHAEAIHSVEHLFPARDVDRRFYHPAGEHAVVSGVRRGDRIALALDRAADIRRWSR